MDIPLMLFLVSGASKCNPSYMAIPLQVNLQDSEALVTSKKKRREET